MKKNARKYPVSRFTEKTVFDRSQEAVFYVVKFGNKYLGEGGALTDNLDDAEAFDDFDDADWAMDDFIDSVDLGTALSDNAYDLQYFIDQEKRYWKDDYETEKKGADGLIDNFDARAEVRKDCSVRGIFAKNLSL